MPQWYMHLRKFVLPTLVMIDVTMIMWLVCERTMATQPINLQLYMYKLKINVTLPHAW